jgi:hypothetical protein
MGGDQWRITRDFEREMVRTEALVVELRGSGGRAISGESRNLSLGGIFVETPESIEVGAEVQLFVGSMRSTSALRVFARVVHVVPGVGFGARFLDDTEEGRGYVAAFLDRFRSKA